MATDPFVFFFCFLFSWPSVRTGLASNFGQPLPARHRRGQRCSLVTLQRRRLKCVRQMEIRGRCGCSSTYFWPIFTPTPKSFRFLPLALTHKSLRKIDVTTHCNLNRRDVCKKKKCTPVIIKPPIFQSVSPQQGRGSCWSPIPGSIGWRPVRGVPDDNRDRAPARPRPIPQQNG